MQLVTCAHGWFKFIPFERISLYRNQRLCVAIGSQIRLNCEIRVDRDSRVAQKSSERHYYINCCLDVSLGHDERHDRLNVLSYFIVRLGYLHDLTLRWFVKSHVTTCNYRLRKVCSNVKGKFDRLIDAFIDEKLLRLLKKCTFLTAPIRRFIPRLYRKVFLLHIEPTWIDPVPRPIARSYLSIGSLVIDIDALALDPSIRTQVRLFEIARDKHRDVPKVSNERSLTNR